MTNLSLNASNVLILGRKLSGKTNLINNLIKTSFKETDTGLVFNLREKLNPEYDNLHCICSVYNKYNSEKVDNYINDKLKGICLGDKPNDKKTFIVFDEIF